MVEREIIVLKDMLQYINFLWEAGSIVCPSYSLGPKLRIEETTVDFNLFPVNSTSYGYFTLSNISKIQSSFHLDHMHGFFPPLIQDDQVEIEFNPRSGTLLPGDSVTIDVSCQCSIVGQLDTSIICHSLFKTWSFTL